MNEAQKAVAKEFDEYDSNYRDAVNKSLVVPGLDVDYFSRVKAGYLVDLTNSYIEKRELLSALDIGCGVGIYPTLLKDHFSKISGVDVSQKCIEQACALDTKTDYRIYDGVSLPYADNSFNVAYAICVVHHVPKPQWQVFFAEMFRVCKPGGIGVIFEHNPRNPLTMRAVNRCPFDKNAILLEGAETEALLKKAGFENVKHRSIISIPSIGRISRKIDQTLGQLGLGAQYFAIGTKRA